MSLAADPAGTTLAARLRHLTVAQVTGIAAQFAFAAPSLVASLVLARFADLTLVGDLAVAFGLSGAVSAAASFNLSQALALWGLQEFSEADYWVNRILSSAAATLVTGALAALLQVSGVIVLVAVLVKMADGGADLHLGLDIVRANPAVAMRRFLRWSLWRLAVFASATAAAVALGLSGANALVVGAATQFVLMQPWRGTRTFTLTRGSLAAAARLGKRYAFLSASSASSGALVTAPRLAAKYIVSPALLGYYGIACMAMTLAGMSFNLVWYNVASANRLHGIGAAWREFGRTGAGLGLLLAFGTWAATPLVAAIYGISDPAFMRIFPAVGVAFVIFYCVMCITNLLKTSSWRLLETSAYLAALCVLSGIAALTQSVVAGILGAAVTLAAFVHFGLRDARQRA
jgi:hypothetical protein